MHFSGLQVFGWLFLLVGTGTLIAGLFTDYWAIETTYGRYPDTKYDYRSLSFDTSEHHQPLGLWRHCASWSSGRSCLRSAFKTHATLISEPRLEPFELLALLLCGLGALIAIGNLVVSPCSCNNCHCCFSISVLFSGIFTAAGSAVYGYFIMQGRPSSSFEELYGYGFFQPPRELILSASYYLVAVSSAIHVVAGLIFACSRQPTGFQLIEEV